MWVWMALGLGLAGSLHCVGMCGPIALSLPIGSRSALGKVRGVAVQNTGRLLAYALLGLAFGSFGRGLSLAGWHRWISIGAGILMMASVLIPALLGKLGAASAGIQRSLSHLKTLWFSRFKPSSDAGLFGYGLINGWLPCGLVYTAVLGSLTQASALNGAAFMLVFGAGTLPVLVSLAGLGSWVTPAALGKVRSLVPVAVLVIGALFILRGLDLGIPFISPPSAALSPGSAQSCH